MKRGASGTGYEGGSRRVFVDGFDFGTTDEQLEAHMSQVGNVEEIHWVSKGSANVNYSSASEATAAIKELHKTTLAGNSRYIDVVIGGDTAFKRHKGDGKGKWGSGGKSWGKGGGGKRGKGGDHSDEDPAGSGRVFVRGFDFGTTDDQLLMHMSKAGPVHDVHWVNQGNAVVVYKTQASADKAVAALNQTTIEGNSRYIDVVPRETDGRKGGNGGKGGKFGKGGDHSDEDPAGSGRVFVRGFDFGTTDEQLTQYMARAGPVHTLHWVNQGNAIVVYKRKGGAEKAVATLNQTTIPGNSRYIDVAPR